MTLQNLQSLRFFAALWVAALHFQSDVGVLPLPVLNALVSLGYAGVDIFFVLSGYIMAMTTADSCAGSGDSLRFFARRLLRIYSGWWPFFVLYLLYFSAKGNLGEHIGLGASLLLLPQNLFDRLLPITWSLSFELWFYLVTGLMLLAAVSLRIKMVQLWAVLVLSCNTYWLVQGLYRPENIHQINLLHWFFLSPMALQFIAGYLLFHWFKTTPSGRAAAWFVALIIAASLIALFQWAIVPVDPSGLSGFFHTTERTLLWGSFAFCAVGLFVCLEHQGWYWPKWTARLGDASYSIYLGHVLLLYLLKDLLIFIGAGDLPVLLRFALYLILSCVALFAYHRGVERPLYRLLRRLLPEPSRNLHGSADRAE